MQLRPSVPSNENKDNQVNQNGLNYLANAVEGVHLPSVPEEGIDEEPEEETAEIKPGEETPPFSDIDASEVVTCRTATKGDTFFGRRRHISGTSQYLPMETDESHDEPVSCTLVPGGNQICDGNSPNSSHNHLSRPTGTETHKNDTTQASRSSETRQNLRAKSTLKRNSDFLVHQILHAREALRPVSTRGGSTQI